MGDNSAENTSGVTRGKGDHHLSSLAVTALLVFENVSIESCDNLLESNELNNSVWDLSQPKWFYTCVELSVSLDSLISSNTGGWEFTFS